MFYAAIESHPVKKACWIRFALIAGKIKKLALTAQLTSRVLSSCPLYYS